MFLRWQRTIPAPGILNDLPISPPALELRSQPSFHVRR